MIFDWFKTREINEFARAIVDELKARIPPDGLEVRNARKAWDKVMKTKSILHGRMETFAHSHKLNIYQKASFGNTIKWALKDAGYTQEFTDIWTHELMTFIAVHSQKASKTRN